MVVVIVVMVACVGGECVRECLCMCVCVRARARVRACVRVTIVFCSFASSWGDPVRLIGLTNSSFDYFAVVSHDSQRKKSHQRLRLHETNSLVNSKLRGLVL